jgi:hypothetical protein
VILSRTNLRLAYGALLAAVAANAGGATISFQQGTASYAGSTDTWIRSDPPNTGANNGAVTSAVIGSLVNPGDTRYLIEWDLSGILVASGGQPVTIDSANLKLVLSASFPANSGDPSLVLEQYGFDIAGVSSWDDPDGDGNAATGDLTDGGTIGTNLVPAATYAFSTTSITPIFLTSPAFVLALETAANAPIPADRIIRFMLREINPEFTIRDTRGIFSNEWSGTGTASNPIAANGRPILSVEYSIVPEPSAFILGGMALLGCAFAGFGKRFDKNK